MGWPKIEYTDETMREGMQIESARIGTDDKVRLLDALSQTGLKRLVVGAFVSPKWTPQMSDIDEVVRRMTPREGVTYIGLALNQKGVERASAYVPPLTVGLSPIPRLFVHLCDVFVRRNVNVSQEEEIDRWPAAVQRAVDAGATEAAIWVNAAWGSNFTGGFSRQQRMDMLGREHELWTEAGIKVTTAWLGDPMSWNMPHNVEDQLAEMRRTWPEISTYGLHLHNARGMALPSMYAAMRALDESCTLQLDGTVGGIGGCPYCGNGQATGMVPTEDFFHMLQAMGIDTGVDVDALIRAAWLAEEIVGRPLYGRVSKAGPLPRTVAGLYPTDLPFVEDVEEARHFALGAAAIPPDAVSPWPAPIESQQRKQVEAEGRVRPPR
jgi:hydroxymethylglutaryl-CoA lyase